MSKSTVIKVEAPKPRSAVAVAMMRRYGNKGGPMRNPADKRAAQKERRTEANAW